MPCKLKCFSILSAVTLFSACATTKYVTPQEKIKEPWSISADSLAKHRTDGSQEPSQEATASATAEVSVEVVSPDGASTNDALELFDKAILAPQKSSWIKIENSLNVFEKAGRIFYQLFMSPAFASSKTSYRYEISGAEATQLVTRNPEASKLFSEIDSFKIMHEGAAKPEFMTLHLKMKNGSLVSGVVDFDWKRTCKFLDRNLPSTRKLTFAVSDKKNVASKMRHPFEGKSCSKSRLDAYRYFNFDAGVKEKVDGVPASVLLVAKDRKKDINLAFFRNEEGNPRSVGTALWNAFNKTK